MVYQLSCITVFYDTDLRLLRWQWIGSFNDIAFREALQQLLELARNLHPYRCLVDTSSLPAVSLATQQWLSDEWLPHYQKLHIQMLAVLLPSNLHNQLALESMVADARPAVRCDMQYFTDELAALDWLALTDEEYAARLQQQWLIATVR